MPLNGSEAITIEQKQLTVMDLKRANVPERFWYVTISSIPKDMPYMSKLLSYYAQMEQLMEKGVGLYLYSDDNQTGKTSIAVALLKRALRLRKTALFEEAGRLKDGLARNDSFDETFLLDQRVRSVDLLVIDDLGKEYRTTSGYAETTFENIFRDRIQTLKPIIVTGNMRPKEISSTYSASLAALLKSSLIPLQIMGYNWGVQKEAELKKIL